MTPAQIREARATLGVMWGLDRPLYAAELGRALGLGGRDPGRMVSLWEAGEYRILAPTVVAIEAMLAGYRPPGAGIIREANQTKL